MRQQSGLVIFFLCLGILPGAAGQAQGIHNRLVEVKAARDAGVYTGFNLLSGGKTAALVRLSSRDLITAARCQVGKDGRTLTFSGLMGRRGTGLRLGPASDVVVRLAPGDPYPVISLHLSIGGFDATEWQATVGKEPFHFLALYMEDAEAWHQRGWLNATPLADPFPLLGDVHAGTPEISAYHYNRNWSYTPPLGAHPLPLIGLWSPHSRHYAGLEFQTTRLEDNSARDIATGYCWDTSIQSHTGAHTQFVALVYPYGGRGYQQLVFPTTGTRLSSHGTLLWNLDMDASKDPNRFFWAYLWARMQGRLPRVPAVTDLSWLPGRIRLHDFAGPAEQGLVGAGENRFLSPGTVVMGGWGWRSESPIPLLKRNGTIPKGLEDQAARLLQYARRFSVEGDPCVFWEQPLEGQWAPEWGGKGVTTLHNANGFAVGRLFLGLYHDDGKKEYLPIVDGVLNWAKHIAWTRNEFPDVPSSPFAIGGTLSASFCLDYYAAFRNAPDEEHQKRAAEALDLAHSLTYRYMILWPSDNDRMDNLQPAFLWEPNSGRDWTGAACANEVFWNLDTLAQTAVMTGDPVLMWALQGSLDRWHFLYQESYKDTLADYAPSDMTEGYGLYAGNVYGPGSRAPYGFASPLEMTEPVGSSVVRVLAGEKAAMFFNKEGVHTGIRDYHYTWPGNFSFTLRSLLSPFDLSLTAPYVDISQKPVSILREGRSILLAPGKDFIRPPQALWSILIRNLRHGDTVILGQPASKSPALPTLPPLTQGMTGIYVPPSSGPWEVIKLPYDSFPDISWDHLDSWAGLPRGQLWAYGISMALPPASGRSVLKSRATLALPVTHAQTLLLAYSAGSGPPPSILFSDGSRARVDTTLEAMAWRNWPPIYTARLLIAPVQANGKTVAGIDPGGRLVWALSGLRQKAPVGEAGSWAAVRSALQEGAAQWRLLRKDEEAVALLRQEAASVPQGSLAVLPPSPTGPEINLAQRSGLLKRAVSLTPDQLAKPAFLDARRFPAALYSGGEIYLHTAHAPGDAAGAVLRYVNDGGTLLLLSTGPWPMFYATGPGFQRPDPLTTQLGLPLYNAMETLPPERLTVREAAAQQVLQGVPAAFPFPGGDPRLRSIQRKDIPPGARYTPIYTVTGSTGKDYGDAAGLVEFPGGGKILYIWGGLLQDTAYGPAIRQAALRATIRFLSKSNSDR